MTMKTTANTGKTYLNTDTYVPKKPLVHDTPHLVQPFPPFVLVLHSPPTFCSCDGGGHHLSVLPAEHQQNYNAISSSFWIEIKPAQG